jgi:hypothetical protein
MSKEPKLENIKANLESIKDLNFDILSHNGPNVQQYPNHTSDDIKSLVDDTLSVLYSLEENESLLEDLSFDYLNGIAKTLNNFVAQFQPLKSLKKEQLRNQHHNPLNQLKALNNTLRQYGLYSIVSPSVDIPLLEEQLKTLSGKASIIVKEAEDNAKIIRDLIPDATATSLSTTLRNRASQLELRVNIWLAIVILVLLGSSYFSWKFLTSNSEKPELIAIENIEPKAKINADDSLKVDNKIIKDSLESKVRLSSKKAVTENKNSVEKNDNSIVYWIKRVIIFLPLFYLIVFCIRQYNKERKLLEIYTHKRVIAQTLPAYMEQASPNEEVKSELLLRGASMIFTLPENPDTPIQGTDGIAMNELKTMLQIKKEVT